MISISRPTLLLDETIARRNIQHLAAKAREKQLALVPHFKTHQSKTVGTWFKAAGIDAITVSSVSMAAYFAAAGWQDITIAFPVNLLEIKEINSLAAKVNLTLLVTDTSQVKALAEAVEVLVQLLIEINTGDHRSGLPANDHGAIRALIDQINHTHHRFKGFYSHFGHTYKAGSPEEVKQIYRQSVKQLTDLQLVFADVRPEIHVGDTPSAAVVEDFSGIKALHAGNFVFYDLMQQQIGVCTERDIAVVLACPVVGKNQLRQELVIYGGGVHLSKEGLFDPALQATIYGRPVLFNESSWQPALPGCYLKSISQEHGVLQVTPAVYQQIAPGDVIGILPVHSCMTADTMAAYTSLNGEIIDHFKTLSA